MWSMKQIIWEIDLWFESMFYVLSIIECTYAGDEKNATHKLGGRSNAPKIGA